VDDDDNLIIILVINVLCVSVEEGVTNKEKNLFGNENMYKIWSELNAVISFDL